MSLQSRLSEAHTQDLAGHTQDLAGHTQDLAGNTRDLAGHTQDFAGGVRRIYFQLRCLIIFDQSDRSVEWTPANCGGCQYSPSVQSQTRSALE